MSDWISLELRNFVRQRARGRCEYCQLHEGTLVRLFNPRMDDWSSHVEVVGGRTLGRTPEGRVTVELLQRNRPDLVQLRRLLSAVGRLSQP